ncbi:MAG: chromophore lyase CpcT/CpeT [Ignavibacteria bacterium]|nr:chromophore lyase CpcT/CpeT [Ignavibacteria bacterium]
MKAKCLLPVFFAALMTILLTNNVKSQIKSIDINSLVNLMEGSFSSEEQSKSDSDYFDIRLHMKRIWKDIEKENEEYWLYAEQASAQSPDKPYRQRVYRVTRTYEGRFESAVYTISDPMRFAGAWKLEEPLTELSPDSLTLRDGCTVTLTLMGKDHYEGGTKKKDCESELRDAEYATSKVEIFADRIISWDRGFDKDGKLVWGAEKGGYVFIRIK